jgi:hypothetical protein
MGIVFVLNAVASQVLQHSSMPRRRCGGLDVRYNWSLTDEDRIPHKGR